MGLGLQEVNELGLLGDGPFHFHLLMGVHSLQVELSEHHYCHEFLLKYNNSHREGVTEGQRDGQGAYSRQSVEYICVCCCYCCTKVSFSLLKQSGRTEGEKRDWK